MPMNERLSLGGDRPMLEMGTCLLFVDLPARLDQTRSIKAAKMIARRSRCGATQVRPPHRIANPFGESCGDDDVEPPIGIRCPDADHLNDAPPFDFASCCTLARPSLLSARAVAIPS